MEWQRERDECKKCRGDEPQGVINKVDYRHVKGGRVCVRSSNV